MKIRRLSIDRLAGIDHPFELQNLGDGLNIIIGPNGIGKSRICTAVRALLWHEYDVSQDEFKARAEFEHEHARWQVVREGSRHRWQRDGIDVPWPTLPGKRFDVCFFLGLRDLLDDTDRVGGNLASEIRKQMSGSFDLDKVQKRFESVLSARVGRKESKDVGAAEGGIRRAEQAQAGVERQQRQLESLEILLAEAEAASLRLAAFDTAISLQGLRANRAQKMGELGELPKALENLDGKETLRLDKLLENLVQKRAEREAANDALDESREAANDTRLDAPIDSASLTTWRERAEMLADLEGRIELAREDAATARAAFRASRALLGADAAAGAQFDLGPVLGIEEDIDLFRFLSDSQKLESEKQLTIRRLSLLEGLLFSDQDSRRLELVRRGIEPLRRWLRASGPDSQVSAGALRLSWRTWAVAGAALVAIGWTTRAIPGIQTMPLFAWLAPIALVVIGIGIGFAVAGMLAWLNARTRDSTDWRAVASRQFPDSLEPPSDWSTDAVVECLSGLEDKLARLDASDKRSRDRGVERRQFEIDLKDLERRLGDLEPRRDVLFARLGLPSMRSDFELVDLARVLDATRAAHVEASRAEAKRKALEETHAQLLATIAASLVELEEGAPNDGASAKAAIRSLEQRDRGLRDATAVGNRERKSRDRLDVEIDRLEADKAEIFRIGRIEANDRGELTRVLSHLDRYRELKEEISKLSGGVERAESELEANGEVVLTGSSVAELQKERAVLKAKSEECRNLNQKIAEINHDVRDTRRGHLLEDAIAKKSEALVALWDRRDEALAALAGKSLIESVRREHETNQMPRVLERARHRFAAFTHQRHQLIVSPGDGGSFVAMDAKSGEGLSLDKLSDGTRAQLFLAARLAFAEEVDQGADLPLFLDEAMDHSDPERFHAIAVSLAHMVGDEGRQIFYLTNDPTDIERFELAFEEVGCHDLKTWDLAEIRGEAARVDRRTTLRVAPLDVVPVPEDQDAESYGVAIGVSPLDPSRDASGQHVYYVLRDDLLLLHEFLEARIESVGQCLNILKGGSEWAKSIANRGEVGAGLEARVELLGMFCMVWREGRGAPVGRLEIEASGEVSEKYLDPVVELATEFGGDARPLIAAMRERKDTRLRGYRDKSTDELERFFIDQGWLDDRAILNEAEIIERVVATPAANRLSPRVAAELVHQWWQLSHQARTMSIEV